MLNRRTAILACILVGVTLHTGIWQATGAREPWDSPLYWQVALPLALLAAACVGFLAVGSAWTATILIIPAQIATMMVKSGSAGNLWPLSFALGVAMGLPFLLVAYIASRFRKPSRRT